MIVQTPLDGRHFVIAMHQHTAFAGSLAATFGNESFDAIWPADPMQFVVDHHDHGWAELDAEAPMDPNTGLPYNLTATPLNQIVATSAGSPEFNEKHHPFSGLISSMHTAGLYNGRYGMSDKIFLDQISSELRPEVDAMLEIEQERQDRLRSELEAEDPAIATDSCVLTAYKQLQFFDTFSLYLHMSPPGQRGAATFNNLPKSAGEDVSVTVTEHEGSIYALDPFPFAIDGLELHTEGRYLTPQPMGTDLAELLAATDVSVQTVQLVAG